LDSSNTWIEGKTGGDCQKGNKLHHGPPISGRRWSRRSPKIQVQGILVARKLGIRIVYLKFEGIGFGWERDRVAGLKAEGLLPGRIKGHIFIGHIKIDGPNENVY
jgi:hypothetical protein